MIGRTCGSIYFLAAKVKEWENWQYLITCIVDLYYSMCNEDLLKQKINLFCSQQPKITFSTSCEEWLSSLSIHV